MSPYFDDGTITLYHGDFRRVMPEVMDECSVMVTDPPYGVMWASMHHRSRHTELISGDDSTDARDGALELWDGRPALAFGSWRYPDSAASAALFWERTTGGMGDLSMPWSPNVEVIFVHGRGFRGHRGSSVLRHYGGRRGRRHPAEKPVPLLLELIRKCPEGVVLDPFAGSGSTLEAARLDGRSAVGIELEERWCELAAKRLSQSLLFAASPNTPPSCATGDDSNRDETGPKTDQKANTEDGASG